MLKGNLRMHIGDETPNCKPGNVWRHPQGDRHMSEALEDAVLIEIKSPVKKTWTNGRSKKWVTDWRGG